MNEQQTTENPQEQVDSDAAFAAGFDQARGADKPAPAPEAKPEASPPKTEEPKVEGAPTGTEKPEAPDDWAGVPPKVKAEFESIHSVLKGFDSITKQLEKVNANIGGLKSQQQEIRSALAGARAEAQAKGAEAPTAEQVESARKNEARWKQLKEDFPDWAEAMDDRLAQLERSIPKAAPVDASAIKAEIVGDVDQRIAQARKEAREEARVFARIDAVHEGWEETVNTPEFETWYRAQPPEVQKLSASPLAKDAIRMLDLFAEQKKKQAEKAERDKRLARAITPQGTAVTAVTEDPDAAFEAGFNNTRGR